MKQFIDYYNILGVSKNASKEEIKRAYRIKAKQFHPDTGGSNEKFVFLKQVFDVLYNDSKRRQYDQLYEAYKEKETNNHSQNSNHDDENTNQSDRTDKRTREQETTNTNNDHQTQKQSNKTIYSSNTLKKWRAATVVSVIINFVLIFLLIDVQSTEESVQSSIIVNEANLISQAEYDKLLNDNSILEERLSNVLEDYNEQTIYIEELENRNSEKSSVSSVENNTDVQKTASSESGTFTLGSLEKDVKQIMGSPDSIIGNMWGYELSYVTFTDGKVSGWNDISNNLSVNINKSGANISAFTTGSSFQDVIDVMGTPDSIIGDMWGYELSYVTFTNGKVTGWNDISSNLKIE